MKIHQNIWIIFIFTILITTTAYSDNSDFSYFKSQHSFINIRNNNGKFYAYIVLLYNENPHFVNMIQEDSITTDTMKTEKYHIKAYRHYIQKLNKYDLIKDASLLLKMYLHPDQFQETDFKILEKKLVRRNIILKFLKSPKSNNLSLEYCIFGKKSPITGDHPFFKIHEKIYNISPLIYYDEFSTSNSTFYFDMIYINPEEVQNDYMIIRKILNNDPVNNMFYVGARLNDDIIYCIKKAFPTRNNIKDQINSLFEVHEITHKVLNNKYNLYDQVIGEEMAMSSTIYANPYLGLSVMYCYLDYNSVNPHRIGALNYIRYIANASGEQDLYEHPSKIKYLPEKKIKELTKRHFFSIIKALQ